MRLVKKRAERLSEEETKQILDEVLASKRADQGFFNRMLVWKEALKGNQWPDEWDEENRVTINLTYAFIRALIPTLFFREPTIKAYPLNPSQEGKEKIWEMVTNNSYPRMGLATETTKELFDAATYAEGWSKLVVNKGPDDAEDPEERGAGGLSETARRSVPWQTLELPVWLRVSPFQVVVDRDAEGRDLDKARFVAIEYLRPYDEMKADPRYNMQGFDEGQLLGRAQNQLGSEPSSTTEERRGAEDFVGLQESKATGDLVRFYEVWVWQMVGQRLWKQMVVVAPGAAKPLRGPIVWEELVGRKVKGWPFERLVLNYVPDDLPMSEIEVWYEIQQTFNWAMSMITNQLQAQVDIVELRSDMVRDSSKAKEQILAGNSIEVVETNGEGGIQRHPRSAVSGDAYNTIALLERFAEKVSGMSGQRMGEARSVRTATESSLVEQGIQIVTDYKVQLVQNYLKSKTRKWQSAVRDVLPDTAEFVMRMAGDTGSVDWRTFTAEDLDWEPDIEIEVNSFRKAEFQEEMQRWSLVLNMAVQLFPLLGPTLDYQEMFAQFARAAGVTSVGEIVGDTTDQSLLQMAEIIRMVLGEEVPVSPTDAHRKHVEVIQFFTNSDLWGLIGAPAQARIQNHWQQHLAAEQQVSELSSNLGGGKTTGPNYFDDGNPEAFNPANEARRRTAQERSAVEPEFGAGGQLG